MTTPTDPRASSVEMEEPRSALEQVEYRLAVAYQVVGVFLDNLGAHDTYWGQQLLDYLNGDADAPDPLPFSLPSAAALPSSPDSEKAGEIARRLRDENRDWRCGHVVLEAAEFLESISTYPTPAPVPASTPSDKAVEAAAEAYYNATHHSVWPPHRDDGSWQRDMKVALTAAYAIDRPVPPSVGGK